MEQTKILTADFLDILFEDRNKAYGAYELRRTYAKRLLIALTSMCGLCLLLFMGYLLSSKFTTKNDPGPIIKPDITLVEIEPPLEDEPLPPPPQPPKLKMVRSTTLVIVHDDVKEWEKPPVVDEFEGSKIGLANQTGDDFDDVVAPPVDGNTGVIAAPKRDVMDDQPFTSVQIESQYPGGLAAWQRYLYKNIVYPKSAEDNRIEGTVLVQFIVDRSGAVSDVQVISGPEELREEAIRAIKKSGKWTPAIQNGQTVKSYKRQPIGFRLQE